MRGGVGLEYDLVLLGLHCFLRLAHATSLSTGGGPVSYVQLSEGGFQVVNPLGLWLRFSGVVKVLYGYG